MLTVSDDLLADLIGNYKVWVKAKGYAAVVVTVPGTTLDDGPITALPKSRIGDFNSDGKITRPDWTMLVRHIRNIERDPLIMSLFGDKVPFRIIADVLRNVVHNEEDPN